MPQYLDNRQVYGYLTLTDAPEDAAKLLGPELDVRLAPEGEEQIGVVALS